MCLLPRLMWLSSRKVLMGLPWGPAAALTVGVTCVVARPTQLARGTGRNEWLVIKIAALADDSCMLHVVGPLSLSAGPAFAIGLPKGSTCVWAARIVVFI